MWIVFPFVMKLTFGQKVIHSRENTQLLLTFITGITDSFPTYFISILIFLNIFRKCMQRPMWCCISQVHKEWFIILCIFFHFLHSAVRKSLGYIISFGYFLYRHFTFYQTERIKVIHHSINYSIVRIKPTIDGIMT